ncbi:MAG: hypothetical protein JSW39_21415, partial [Desulfobacterales bacterium]
MTHHYMNGIGAVVIKFYRRGGLIRHLVKRRYLKWGKTRGQIEYELLDQVRELGVNAPEPIAYAFCGSLFYKGWLVVRAINQPRSLVQLSSTEPEKIPSA